MPRELRRVFVGDLQPKSARLFEVGAQLPRPASFALAVLVAFFDTGGMKLINDGVEIIIGYGKGKVAAAIGVFGHLRSSIPAA